MQLYELQAARGQIIAYDQFIQREKDLDAKERDNWQRQLDLEKQATTLKQKEVDLVTEKANLYQSLYNTAKKKKAGFGCVMGRVFTFGLYRCGG